MRAKIKLEHVYVQGVDTCARAAGLKQWITGRGAIHSPHIPILTDVSFEARPGDRVGILGLNGSGKSSLLKVISGHYPPYAGRCEVQGSVAPLIEMGAGFDPEISGRKNIKLTYAYRGKLRDYTRAVEDAIIDYAALGANIDLPLKTYSNGMRARLAFASAIFQQPDILLLDEVFAAGDAAFVEKSRATMIQRVHEVAIALLVNHGVDEMMTLCNRAVVMHQGRMVAEGTMPEMAAYYTQEILRQQETV